MEKRCYETGSGVIRYWTNSAPAERPALVFLPGLTADHHLFDRQTEAFGEDCRVLTWDAPGHGESRPFTLDFTLMDKAQWLHDILEREGWKRPVLIGQSMGGYVAQCFLQRYPGAASGFVSIDSAPLKRCYVSDWEIWLLKRTEPMYRAFPWKLLRKLAAEGCAVTPYGRELMAHFLSDYTKQEYCALAGNGFGMLAEAMEADLPYSIDCPALLICGKKDHAGSAAGYNRRWAAREGLPLCWIEDAGHNANTDKPEEVNRLIREFLTKTKTDAPGPLPEDAAAGTGRRGV